MISYLLGAQLSRHQLLVSLLVQKKKRRRKEFVWTEGQIWRIRWWANLHGNDRVYYFIIQQVLCICKIRPGSWFMGSKVDWSQSCWDLLGTWSTTDSDTAWLPRRHSFDTCNVILIAVSSFVNRRHLFLGRKLSLIGPIPSQTLGCPIWVVQDAVIHVPFGYKLMQSYYKKLN